MMKGAHPSSPVNAGARLPVAGTEQGVQKCTPNPSPQKGRSSVLPHQGITMTVAAAEPVDGAEVLAPMAQPERA